MPIRIKARAVGSAGVKKSVPALAYGFDQPDKIAAGLVQGVARVVSDPFGNCEHPVSKEVERLRHGPRDRLANLCRLGDQMLLDVQGDAPAAGTGPTEMPGVGAGRPAPARVVGLPPGLLDVEERTARANCRW